MRLVYRKKHMPVLTASQFLKMANHELAATTLQLTALEVFLGMVSPTVYVRSMDRPLQPCRPAIITIL